MRAGIVGAAALALILTSSAALARDIPAGGFTTGDIIAWLHSKGYPAELTTGSGGLPHVRSNLGDVTFGVYLFDCKADRCGSIQFSAGFATHGKFDISRINEWNRDHRWARGYFDSVNDPWIEYDIDLTPGGTYELLDDEFVTWNTMVDRFTKLYGLP